MKKIFLTISGVIMVAGLVHADLEDLGEYDKSTLTLSAGYYFVERDDNSARAGEYLYQDDSVTGALTVKGGNDNSHFMVEGLFLNENDFLLDVHFDRNNVFRIDLRTEKLFHNLDHLVYDPSHPEGRTSPTLAGTTTTPTRATFTDFNVDDEYYLKGLTSEAKVRVKLPDMPSHINIGYWQFQKEGKEQFRFVDEGCAASQCHFQSRTREFDRTTHEISGAIDAHLGKVDLILKHTYREFVVDEPVPEDPYANHSRFRPGAGDFQHDVDPESYMYESTMELHSSFAGGLNLAGSATLGTRKNDTKATGASPIEAEVDYLKAAFDVTHITSSRFSYNFKSRYLDLDNENSVQIDPFIFDGAGGVDPDPTLLSVRPSIDIERAEYEINASYRKSKALKLKGKVKVEHVKRSETGDAMPFHSSPFTNDTVWELPDEEISVTGKIGFHSRPYATPRSNVNGWYKYQYNDDPAYGASSADSHQVFLSTSYVDSQNWGLNASVSALFETNDEIERTAIDESALAPAPYLLVPYELERTREQETVSLGVWVIPAEQFYSSLNYGYNRVYIEQDLSFGMDPADSPTSPFTFIPAPSLAGNYIIIDEDVPYLQEVHNFNYHFSRKFSDFLKANLDLSYTRSLGYFDPDFATISNIQYNFGGGVGDASSDGFKSISQYDIDQYGVRFGVDIYPADNMELAFTYTYDDYREKYSDAFDGSVQAGTAYLAYRF